MKKYISLISIVGIIVLLFNVKGVQATNVVEDINDKLIRFHVLANSNGEKDQELKLKVRDAVIEYVNPMLNNSKSIEQSREILLAEEENIIKISEDIIKKEGYDYKVTTELGKENFPEKTYGNITLPQGEYEAFRILIGEAKGDNWWCVMFPPLCFVDMTKGQISYEESEKQLSEVLTEEERKAIIDDNNTGVEFKFKLTEIFNFK